MLVKYGKAEIIEVVENVEEKNEKDRENILSEAIKSAKSKLEKKHLEN
jgi:hypothetical protein